MEIERVPLLTLTTEKYLGLLRFNGFMISFLATKGYIRQKGPGINSSLVPDCLLVSLFVCQLWSSVNIHRIIGNLPSEVVTKRDIFRIFYRYGKLAQISIKQAYGFVQFLDPRACHAAMQGEQGMRIKDRNMRKGLL